MPKKEKQGIVISNKMDKTVVVKVADYEPHPKYKKIIESNKTIKLMMKTTFATKATKLELSNQNRNLLTNAGQLSKLLKKLNSKLKAALPESNERQCKNIL